MSAVKSTHDIGYLTLIISFHLLQYKDSDIKVCQSSALASFNFTKSWDKVILLCSNFNVLQVSGKHNFIVPDAPWKPKRIDFFQKPKYFHVRQIKSPPDSSQSKALQWDIFQDYLANSET